MSQLQPTTLMMLNSDCISEIFAYLPIEDQLKFFFITETFDAIIEKSLRLQSLELSKCRREFGLQQFQQIYLRFGSSVKNLHFDDWINEHNIEFYKCIPQYFENLSSLKLNYDEDNIQEGLLLQNSMKIENLYIYEDSPYSTLSIHITPPEYEESLFKCFPKLENLRSLQLIALDKVSGENFHLLKNLVHLDVCHCLNYQPDFFVQLCTSPIKLLSLNITGCVKLAEEHIDVLIEHQNELEDLAIDCVTDLYEVATLNKLRKITILDEGFHCKPLRNIFSNLLIASNLEKLRIDSRYHIPTADCVRQILLFKNLKELYLPSDICYKNNFLVDLARELPALQELRVYLNSRKSNTYNGIYAIMTQLTKLKKLVVVPCFGYDIRFWHRISSERIRLKLGLLCVKCSYKNDECCERFKYIVKMKEYQDTVHVLRLC